MLLAGMGGGKGAEFLFPVPLKSGILRRMSAKPLRLFFCAGEPSGDLHAANLIRRLRERCAGFAGGGLRRPAHGGRRLPLACRPHRAGRNVVPPRAGESPQVLGPGRTGRPLLPPPAARRRRADRLSRLQLVDRMAGEDPRHPRILLHAAADLGLGHLAGKENAPSHRPRAMQSAVRGAVVPRARLQCHVRRPSVFR